MMTTRASRHAIRGMLAGTGLVALLAGCASAPPMPPPRTMQPGDFKLLAGNWSGTSHVEQEVGVPILGVIYEPGSYFVAPRNSPSVQTPGVMRIVNGEVLYEGSNSTGKMTFHEAPSEWIWKWDGRTKSGNRAVTNELRKSK